MTYLWFKFCLIIVLYMVPIAELLFGTLLGLVLYGTDLEWNIIYPPLFQFINFMVRTTSLHVS